MAVVLELQLVMNTNGSFHFAAPNPVPGIIQGILPPLLLTLLFVILPFILRCGYYRWRIILVPV